MEAKNRLKDKKMFIVGAGISGVAAYNLLYEIGAKPVLYDGNADLDIDSVKQRLHGREDANVLAGAFTEEMIESFEICVVSPGVPLDSAIPVRFKEAGKEILGEIELAYIAGEGRIIAITGTNGKTTTTALVGEITKNYYGESFVVGNIGIPYTERVKELKKDSVVVAEVSSFQLETVETFHPKVSAILNVTPDHLNRHYTMENYTEAKMNVTKNQTKDDFCILNYDDPITYSLGDKIPASPLFFSSSQTLENGCFLRGEDIIWAKDGEETRLLGTSEMKLLGKHNAENVMAAILMSSAFGVPMDSIVDSVKKFRAVEHRIEYVCTKKGVDYYNDSKGTNPDAAIKGIQAMKKPTVLIGGGYDKNSSYDEWIEAFDGKVKCLVLLGQTADAIAACAKKHGFDAVIKTESLQEAVEVCSRQAEPGDAVLLSPACASWGMFPNYEVRGRQFKEFVKQLEE